MYDGNEYRMGGTWFSSSMCEWDLGILIGHKLNMRQKSNANEKRESSLPSTES